MDIIGGFPSYVKRCSDRVDYMSVGGDSGAPVFAMRTDGIFVRGVNWGHDDVTTDAWMSDLYQIELDHGSLIVWDEPLTVSIYGPSDVAENTTCGWAKVVSGGAPPYSYEWLIDDTVVGTSHNYYTNTGTSNFSLALRVTDAESTIETAFLNITVGSGPSCPPMEE